MKQILLLVCLSLLTLGARSEAAIGVDSSGGDPVDFSIPEEKFAYDCKLLIRGPGTTGDRFAWAKKTIRFENDSFKQNEGDTYAAYAVYESSDDGGWMVSTPDGKPPTKILPNFMRGQYFAIQMTMGENVHLSSGPAVKVFIKAKIDGGIISGHSNYVSYADADSNFVTDVSFNSDDERDYLNVSADCKRSR